MLIDTQCITLTDSNFQSEVLEAQMPVLVDCWASWCDSFQRVNPILNELAIDFAEQIKVGRLNVATSDWLAAHYRVRVVPTLLFFRNGQVVKRVIGSGSKSELANQLKTLLASSCLSRSRIACL